MHLSINIDDWNSYLSSLARKNLIYAPFKEQELVDFKIVEDNPEDIIYNSPKTLTPLKHFLFSIKENVTVVPSQKKVMLIGAKGCDLAAIDLLDKVFLDPDYPDPYYEARKKNTMIIGTDCYDVYDNCHCTAYDINPYAEKNCDLIVNSIEDEILIAETSEKGEEFLDQMKKGSDIREASKGLVRKMQKQRDNIKRKLKALNRRIPDSKKTEKIIDKSIDRKDKIWKKYASTCVACGACVVSCPTCHCFLLIDLPGGPGKKMGKVRTYDACQYPGFEKVAAGVDPLEKHFVRFRNRYVCKFINRPEKYDTIACTGCGRCTDACIGKIDKNEVIRALA